MRLLLAFIVWFCLVPAHAAEILILVRGREAGPVLHEGMYREPTWVLWPVADDPLQFNRILALPSGVDWQSDELGGDFDGRPSSKLADRWKELGYFNATRNTLEGKQLFAVKPSRRPTDPLALAASWQFKSVREIGEADEWPQRSLLVAMASGPNPWDEVARLTEKAGGRALVVEIPDNRSVDWSRVWLKGKGWPEGVPKLKAAGVPGLIEAKHLARLLIDPSDAEWQAPMSDPPNEWLGFGHRVAPIALVFLAVGGVYVLGLGVFMSLREQFSRTSLLLLRLLVLGPAAVILAGRLTSLTALAQWPVMVVASFLALFLVAWTVNRVVGKGLPDCHPLWGEFVVGLLVAAGIDPTWSMFSQILGQHRAPISPEAFGALASYAVGANYLFSNAKFPRAVWGFVAISGTLDLLAMSRWASPVYIGAVPLFMAACLRPIVANRLIWLASMVAIGLVGAFAWPGLVYAPDHLVHDFRQVDKFNCDEQLLFLMSPMFVTFSIVALIVGIAGGNFLKHQIRRAMSFSPNSKPYFAAALGFGVAGIFIPLYLHAALATAIAGAVVVLFDAVRVP